jgi:RNA polymerase-binding transcription factor DksA
MDRKSQERLRQKLLQKRLDLTARLERIQANLQRGLEADSAERAKQLEDSDVVDALGNDARLELEHIAATLRRMHDDEFGVCATCGSSMEDGRLEAYPYASECMDCVRASEGGNSRPR